MNLAEVVRDLEVLDERLVICVKKPWNEDAESVLVQLEEDGTVPKTTTSSGFDYFLEVDVAKEVLEVLADGKTDSESRTRLLLYYAENDAYPDWVYGE